MFTLNIKGKRYSYTSPAVMGIINITPDSFYAGSRKMDLDRVLEQADRMLSDGATFLDLGGQSTRPSSERLSPGEEIERVIPAIDAIMEKYPQCLLSIDTFYAQVAVAAVRSGASIVNDISGGQLDDLMIDTVGALHTPYICMHMKGTPQTMQRLTQYNDIVPEMTAYFEQRISRCASAGIRDVIIDPGFGFAKNIEQNLHVLKQLDHFQSLQKPILVGLSRKSTVYKTLGTTAEKALNGTTVLHTLALLKGASILRAHDVQEAVECVKLCEAYQGA